MSHEKRSLFVSLLSRSDSHRRVGVRVKGGLVESISMSYELGMRASTSSISLSKLIDTVPRVFTI